MTDRIVIAQANTPPQPGGTPTKTIQVNKPLNEQAVVIHLDGSTKLDLSAIANESITLVHIGDRLIIIFDNHAQVTLEPFYGDNGQPLTDLTVELGPGRDVSSSEFATLFPVTTDETVLPASGGPNAPSSGANFNDPTVDPFSLPTPLPFNPPDTFSIQFTLEPGAPIPPNTASVITLTGASLNGDTFEGGLATDTINTVGNHPGEPTVVVGGPGSLNALVNFGAAGPGATPFEFVSLSAAQAWLTGLHLTSQGMAVDHVTIVGNTLTASTDPAQTGQPTNDPNPHDVFSLTVNPDGSIVFTLLSPLDDANPGHLTPGPAVLDQIAVDVSGFIQAVDAQGNTLTLANDVLINVHDDAPVLITTISEIPDDGPTFSHDNIPNVVSGTVEESALGSPPDQFGVGNGGGTATVTGDLHQLVAFGADGPDFDLVNQVYDGFQLVSQTNASSWLTGLGLTSHGQAVDFASVSGDTLTAWTGDGPTDPTAHEVFSLTINGDGTYSFTLDNPLDHPNPGHDTPGPENADSLALDLSGLVQAVDFDGDAVTLSGDFTVNVVDDVPVQLQSNTFVSAVVDEGGLTSGTPGDQFGTGNDPGATTDVVGSISGMVAFGADGPDVVNGALLPFQFAVADGTTHDFGLTSHGQEVNFVTVTTNGGDVPSQTLTAWTDGGPANDPNSHEVFTLTLNGDGTYEFTLINPLDDPNPGVGTPGTAVEDSVQIDLSNLIQAVDFDGDSITLSGGFTITVIDDVPVAVSNTEAFGTVDEGGLASGTLTSTPPGDLYGSGNDLNAATSVTESLSGSVHFGADGPAATPFQFVDADTASGWLTGLNLFSHGQQVDFAQISGSELIAWTGGGPNDPSAHEVFSVTLTGSDYTFQLINPFDDPNPGSATPGPAVEDSVQVDLSGLIQAVDFDGDAVTLAGGAAVTVTDDIPVAVSNTEAFGTVDEGGLTSGTLTSTPPGDLYGSGNDFNAATSVTESLSGSVHFGADGPAATPFQFVDADTASGWLTGLNLFSHGQQVDFAQISGSELIAWTGGGPTDTSAHEVFSVTLNGSDYTFQLINPFDDPIPGAATPGAAVEDSVQVDLSGLIQAVDFDGDAATLSGGASVTVIDDIPIAVSNSSATAIVDEGGLSSGTLETTPPGDLYGSGNDTGVDTSATVSLTDSVLFGADGAAATPFQFVDQTTANTWLSGLNLTSHGQAVDFAQIVGSELIAWTGGGPNDPNAHEVFSVTLSGSDYTFQLINPFDDPIPGSATPGTAVEDSVQVDLSGLIQAVDFDGDAVTLSGGASVTVIDDIPVAVSNTAAFGTVDEGGLASGTLTSTPPGDLYGSGNDLNAVTSVTESLSGSVHFGADGPAATPFQFVDADTASGWLTGLNLFSHGQQVDFAQISGSELIAWTGGGPTDTSAHEVFSVTLNGSDYTFQLINPFDDPIPGAATPGTAVEDSVQVDLSGLIQAVDFDGDAVTLAGGAAVTVTDDIPVAVSNTSAFGTVDEGGLASGTLTSTPPGDLYGSGNDTGAGTSATESLSGSVLFGADGPAATPFQFVDADTAGGWLTGLNLFSHGQQVDFADINGNVLTAWTGGGPNDPNAHEVFSVTLNGSDYTFELINPFDDPNPGSATPGPAVEDSVQVDLSGLIQAVDFDGDAVTLSGGASVTVTDDIPVAVSNTSSATVDEGGLKFGLPFFTTGDFFGQGNDHGAATSATASLSGSVQFGADGPASTPFQFVDQTTADGWLSGLNLFSHGQQVDFAQIVGNELIAWTGGGPTDKTAHEVFSVTLNGSDYTFQLINPLDDPNPGVGTPGAAVEDSVQVDLSGLIQAVDFDGDAVTLSGGASVTVIDDVPVLTKGSIVEFVDEGGLTSLTDSYGSGNDPFATTVAAGGFILGIGSLAGLVSFGADGPALSGTFATIADGFQFAVTSGSTVDFGVKSHGLEVDYVMLSSTSVGFDGVSQTLTAYAGQGGPEVFTLTLNGDGTWVFHLLEPLDDPSGHNENSLTLDLSSLVQAVDFDGDSITLLGDFKITVIDDVPVLTRAFDTSGTVDEGALTFSATGSGDLYGDGNDHNLLGASTTVSGSISNLVAFGADGPALDSNNVNNGFEFAVAAGTHDFGVKSHGHEVNFITLSSVTDGPDGNSQTLTAWTDGGAGHEVFTLTLNGDGTYTFTLINPLDDQSGHGENSVTLNLSALVQAVDFDGDSVTLSNDFKITVTDDVPVAVSNTVSGTVDEGGLTFSTTVGDLYGNGNDPGSATSATISLSGSVQFGADGPAATPFQFVSHTTADTWLSGLHLTSHGQSVDFAAISGNVLTAWTGGGPTDPHAHAVFSVTLNSDNTYTFQLINPLDDSNPGHATPGAAVEDSATIDLSGLIQAVDFDGDAVTLSGGASVTVIDDVPVATGNLIENGNFSLGTFTSAYWGGFATPGNVPGWDIESSDVGGAQPGFVQLERVFNGYLGVFMPNGDQMVDLEETPGNIKISQTVDGIVSGGTYALEFFAGASNPASSELKVFWDGNLIDDIHPNGTETPYLLQVTGEAGPNVLTFEEVGPSGDDTGTYLADVALAAGAPFGIVDEGGLTSSTPGDLYGPGNDPTAATSATGTLSGLVSFGADGPDFVSGTGGAPFNAGFQFAVTSGTHDFGLTSHGAEVNFITLSGVTYGTDGTSQTLTAWTNGGLGNDPTSHEVFQLTLNGDGTYTFTLVNPLDDQSGLNENSLILDLSNLVKAIDYDGDTVALASGSFLIDVIDDVPVNAASNTASATVDEGALTFSTTVGDLYGNGNDQGGSATTIVSGSISGVVSFGADGPATGGGFNLVDAATATAWLAQLGLTSHNQSVDFAVVTGDTLQAWTGTGPGHGHEVFSLTLNSDGSYTFQLVNPLDDPIPGHGNPGPAVEDSVAIDLSGLVQATDFDGDTIGLASGDFSITVIDDVPVLVSGVVVSGALDEGALRDAALSGTDSWGTGNDSGSVSASGPGGTQSGSLKTLVDFGADGPAGTDFKIAIHDDALSWLKALDLTSHGVAVDQIMISGSTLTAETQGGSHDVFTLTVNSDGSWTFTLLEPIDHIGPTYSGSGPEPTTTLDLSGFVRAVDFDGDAISLASGSSPSNTDNFIVTITDDVPALAASNTESFTVDEGALAFADRGSGAHGDFFGNGNDQGGSATAIFSGSISGLVSFGADGPAAGGGFQLVDAETASAWLTSLNLTSHNVAIDFAVINGNTLEAWTGQGPGAGHQGAHEVFTLTLNSDGTFTFQLVNPLDDPNPGHGTPGPAVEDSVNIDLSGLVQAFDFDGDLVNLSSGTPSSASDFNVTVIDDVPVLVSGSVVTAGVDEGALTSGNDPTASFSTSGGSGSLDALVSFGADGPAGNDFKFVAHADAVTWLESLDLTSHGSPVDKVTIANGVLTATAENGDPVFSLAVNDDGSWSFTLLAPIDHTGPTYSGTGPEPTTTLDLSGFVQAVDFDGDAITLSKDFSVTVTDDVPVTTGTIGAGTVDESALLSAIFPNGTDQFGQGNFPGTPPTFTSVQALDTLVHFGADGPNADPFQFSVANGGALSLGITSHGQAVDFAAVSGNTLEAWTGSGSADPTAHEVFTLTLNADDTYTFTLLNPIDFDGTHVPGSPASESTTLNLGALVEAVDFDGDAAPLSSAAIAINVVEDGPRQFEAPLVTGSVDEGALAFSASTGDLFGDGNDQGSTTFTASGTLSGLVVFGADGPAFDSTNTNVDGFQFVNQQNGVVAAEASADAWLSLLGLFSHGAQVDDAAITFGDGTATLIASTDPNSPDPHEVFKLVLNGDGTWTFTLLNPLDHPTGDSENSLNIDLTGFVQASDYDGDTILLGDLLNGNIRTPVFSVDVTDDVPIAHGNLIENGDFALGAFAAASWGGVATPGNVPGWTIEASDVGGAQPGFVQLERVFDGYLGVYTPTGDQMVDLEATPGNIKLSQTVDGIVPGATYSLEFLAGASNPASSELKVFWDGNLIDDIHPNGAETPYLLQVTGEAGPNVLTFEEVGPSGDNTGTYLADVSLEAGTPFGIVDEGGLTTPFQGNDPFAPTLASGSIAGLVSFGADGPAAFPANPDVVNGFQFVANAESVLAGMNLSSESSPVDHVTMTSNPAILDNGVETTSTTLEAFANDGHEVFSLTLEGDGTWIFQLAAPLDNPPPPQGAGEDSTIIDFSKLVDALDFDGDVATLASGSFTVDVIDDVPTASNVAATMAANAPETITLTEPANFSFGADGPGSVTFDLADATFLSDPTGGHLTLPTAGQYTINGDSITLDPGADFQALAPGQTATLEIPYTVTDHDGDPTTADIVVTINGQDTITTHDVSILADQTNFAPVNHAGPESTSNNFSIPVLSLLQGDSSGLFNDPLDLTVTGVSSSVPGVTLTSDHDYILFPFLADGTSGTFTITVSDGTATALETVTINQVQTLPTDSGIDEGGLNGNNFLIENIQGLAGFNTLANVSGDNELIANRFATHLDGYDSVPADGKTPLDSGGDDLLVGPVGSLLIAGAGNDTLWGEGGGSTLDGGQVANKTTTFYFQSPNDAGSTVNNFDSQPGQNDVVALSATGFNAAAGSTVFNAGQAVTVGATTGASPVWATGDHLMYDTTNSGLYYSDNGTGAAGHLILLATVTNHTVTGNDVHVVA